jgi:HK97 family phage major capsid protein
MAPSVKELAEERNKLNKEVQELADLVDAEKRAFTPEEQERWDKVNDDFDDLTAKITAGQELESQRAAVSERAAKLRAMMDAPLGERKIGRDDTDGQGNTPPVTETRAELVRDVFGDLATKILGSDGAATHARGEWPEGFAEARSTPEYREAMGSRAEPAYNTAFARFLKSGYRSLVADEVRALQADLDLSGGYLAAGEQFIAQLIKAVDNLVFLRGLGTVFFVPQAESLGAPSLDTDPSDAVWTAEIKTGNEDSDMAFGKRNLHPAPLAKRIKVSRTLLRKSLIAPEQLVRDRLAYKFSVVEENAFLTGNGANQPLGLFTASADGISTARDMSTDNATTAVKADGLINALYNLKAPYQANARWIFHRTLIRDIRKLKDGEGNYLWQSGITADKPDTILQKPFVMSEYAPNTMTSGQYVGIVGDFSFYWIVQAMQLEIQRLDELHAETNQVGFIGRQEVDGMPVLEEAFTRVKLA